MKNFKKGLLIFLVLALMIGGGYLYNFIYQTSHFFVTENAQIATHMVSITPEITGKVLEWNVKESDLVEKDQIIGRQDISTLVASSAINMSQITSAADSIADKANIKSPISGKVILTDVALGQVASPGMTLATIADLENVYVKANIEETAITTIQVGQLVEISVDAYPKKKFTGYVESVGQATESVFSPFPSLNTSGEFSKTTQLIPVKISIVNDDKLNLLPGMNTTVKIHIQ